MSAAIELASTIQTAHIERSPSPHHDLNPGTAASRKEPVIQEQCPATSSHDASGSLPSSPTFSPHLRPRRRHKPGNLPPLPDLRFEQSYLASIEKATTPGQIAWITVRDQVLLPLVQGTLWTLLLAGWKQWNKGARFAGEGIGARVRRWWWGVNGWEVPKDGSGRGVLGRRQGGNFSGKASSWGKRFAREVKEANEGAVSGMGGAELEREVGVW